jgi:quaternary ammonium compound-resistance protein SugE
MAWLYLIIGGIFEVGWAIGLKFSQGFTQLHIIVPTLVAMGISFWAFAKSLQLLPISTAYSVFTGFGSFGTAIAGMIWLGDPVSVLKIVFLFILIACIIGLKVVD